jgi:hypothetical protein
MKQMRVRWVYLLPTLHLCACFISMIGFVIPSPQYWGIAWVFIMIADLPVSVVAYALAWEHSSLAMIWIFVVGTLWWYVLSVGIRRLFGEFRDRRESSKR